MHLKKKKKKLYLILFSVKDIQRTQTEWKKCNFK